MQPNIKNKILKLVNGNNETAKAIFKIIKNNNPAGFCEVEDCNEPAINNQYEQKCITDLEFTDHLLPKKKYCWARFGITARLCKEHYSEALDNFYKLKRKEINK